MPVKQNIVANIFANAWMAVISIAMVPLYIHFIGIESYGLLGVFGTLQAITSLLDMGLSMTMNREMARYSSKLNNSDQVRSLVRTLEVIYWAIAFLIWISIWLLAPFLSQNWITSANLSKDIIRQAILLNGLAMFFLWPQSFYEGGLMGLQKQVLLSKVKIGAATMRALGAVIILWLISPTIQAFLGWQIVINITFTVLIALILWRNLPGAAMPSFQVNQLRKVWRFSVGVAAISMLGVVLTQADKVILSKLLTLDKFGYYTIAGTMSTVVLMLVNPVYNAIFPRLSQLIATNDQDGMRRFYHQSAQVMTVLVVPIVVILALFSSQILLIWQGNPVTVENTYWLMTLFVISTGLQGLAHIPWALQLAQGWTRLGFYINLVAIPILLPLLFLLVSSYGALGAAFGLIFFNLSSLLTSVLFMHRKFLKGELMQWLVEDVGIPSLAVLVIAGLGRLIVPVNTSRLLLLVFIVVVSGLSQLTAVLVTPMVRSWIFTKIVDRRNLV